MNLMRNANKNTQSCISWLIMFYVINSLLFLLYIPTYAATVQLTINPIHNLVAGLLSNRKLLALSKISTAIPHCGFKITLNNSNFDPSSNDYILTNHLSAYRHLNIQLMPQGNIKYKQQENGLIVLDKTNNLDIAILSNGSQQIDASLWPLTMSASLIPCH